MRFAFCLLLTASVATIEAAQPITVRVDTVMAPPTWALLERELLRANTAACEEFFARYFDERGRLLCVERWGGDDGPDDAIENCNDWPLLHALGAPDVIRAMARRAWEGHLRQYTEAKTTEVPFARDGMYFKEFPVMFDWQHNNEGLLVFHLMSLSEPDSERYRRRVCRYAGFYMNEDAGAANYDPRHQLIRSLFNGSRGPLLRKATALDWTGDPIEVEHRFQLGHGERSYEEMLAHFKDYNDIVGDHPLNLLSTSLALNAFMVTGDFKYKRWLLEYVNAWRQRMINNDDVIPSNIGLDGAIGGACDGKWYGGTYGWGFTVVVPQTGALADRNRTYWGFTGFMNAYLLTGDDRYLEPWRKQCDKINAQARTIDGQTMYPRMHDDQGWYGFVPQKYSAMRNDTTTPDTRLADDPMRYNPAQVAALRKLMLGGIYSGKHGSVLHCRLRYFDPVARRAGVPEDVAALVERMSDDEVTFTLVNVSQVHPRELIVQAGAYAEHQFSTISLDGQVSQVDSPNLRVQLAPGSGSRITVKMRRHVNPPTAHFPWSR